jgi:hypothetical protein
MDARLTRDSGGDRRWRRVFGLSSTGEQVACGSHGSRVRCRIRRLDHGRRCGDSSGGTEFEIYQRHGPTISAIYVDAGRSSLAGIRSDQAFALRAAVASAKNLLRHP